MISKGGTVLGSSGPSIGGNPPTVSDIVHAGNIGGFYEDDPGALGAGTREIDFIPKELLGVTKLRVSLFQVRIEFPAAAGESSLIRLYRYRKKTPTGPFDLDQISSTYTVDNTHPWSFTVDATANLLPISQDIDTNWDGIAISNVYTPGGAPTMRALRVDIGARPGPGIEIAGTAGVATWAP